MKNSNLDGVVESLLLHLIAILVFIYYKTFKNQNFSRSLNIDGLVKSHFFTTEITEITENILFY